MMNVLGDKQRRALLHAAKRSDAIGPFYQVANASQPVTSRLGLDVIEGRISTK